MGFGDTGAPLKILLTAVGAGVVVGEFDKIKNAAKGATSSAESDFARLTSKAEQAAKKIAAETKAIDQAQKNASKAGAGGNTELEAAYLRVGEKAKAGLGVAQGELSKAEQGLSNLSQKADQTGGILGSMGMAGAAGPAVIAAAATAAAGAVIKFGEAAISNYTNAALAVRDFGAKAGTSAEESSKLLYAAKALDVDTESLTTSMFRLAGNVDKQPQLFAKWGVEIARTKTGAADLEGTFNNLLARMNQLGPGAQSDALARALVGRGGASLAPLAAEYTEFVRLQGEAAKNGALISESDIQKTENYKQEMTALSTEFGHFERTIAAGVLPALTQFMGGLEQIGRDAGQVVHDIDSVTVHTGMMGKALLGAALGPAAPGVFALGEEIMHLGKKSSDAAKATAALDAAEQKLVTDAAQAAQAQKDAADATTKIEQASQGVADAIMSVVDAQEASATAVKKVAEVEGQMPGVLGAVAQKAHDVAEAERTMGSAQETLDQATLKLNDDLETTAERHDKLALSARSAANAVLDAQDAYRAAVDEYGAGSRQAQEAADAVTSAQFNQADAQRALNKPDTTVADDRRAVAAATQGVADAQLAINKAENEDPAAEINTAHEALLRTMGQEEAAQQRLRKAAADANLDSADLAKTLQGLYADAQSAGANPATLAVFQWLIAASEAITGNKPDWASIFPPGAAPWQMPGSPASVGSNTGAPSAPTGGIPSADPTARPSVDSSGNYVGPGAGQTGAAPPGAGGTPGHTGGVQEAALVAPTVDKSVTVNLYGSQATPHEMVAAVAFHQAVRG